MHPNSTFPLKYDPNKGAEGLRPGRLWAPRDWRSFVEAAILRKMLLMSVTFFRIVSRGFRGHLRPFRDILGEKVFYKMCLEFNFTYNVGFKIIRNASKWL